MPVDFQPHQVDFQPDAHQAPQKQPFSATHFSDSEIKDGVIHGARRGASGIGAESARLSLGSGAPPGVHAYRDGSVAHPQVGGRKHAHKIAGHKAIAQIESEPLWNSTKTASAQQAIAKGADPAVANGIGTNAAEHALKGAGYDGYESQKQPGSVFLFGDQHVARPNPGAEAGGSAPLAARPQPSGVSAAPTLYMVRHAKTKFNAPQGEERIRGWSNVPLDAHGEKETGDIAAQMAGTGVKHVLTSDLQRSVTTGQKIAQATGAMHHSTPELRPWNLGQLTGQKLTDIMPQLTHYSTHPDETVPGGESYNQFYGRFRKVLGGALSHVTQNPHEPVAIVAHHRHLLALPSLLHGGLVGAADTSKVPMKSNEVPGSIVKVTGDGNSFKQSEFYKPPDNKTGTLGSY